MVVIVVLIVTRNSVLFGLLLMYEFHLINCLFKGRHTHSDFQKIKELNMKILHLYFFELAPIFLDIAHRQTMSGPMSAPV